MNNNYPITTEQLYEATNGGLDIYSKYLDLPNNAEKGKVKFKYRDSETTPSCVLSLKDNVYFLVDFGGKSYNPVSFVMDKFGYEFGYAFKMLCDDFNLTPNGVFYKPEKEFKDTYLELGYFDIKFKPFQSLELIGRFVPEIENELESYNFHEVEYYEKVIKSSKTQQPTLLKVVATENYPIFAYTPDAKVWVKLYEPKATKNEKGFSSKHSYLGDKPKRYVHGLERLLKLVDLEYIKEIRERIRTATSKDVKEEYELELDGLLLDSVYCLSGGTDGLNHFSLDPKEHHCIWYNSESEQLNHEEYKLLKTISKQVYNIPDIDKAGVIYGKEVAENYWELKSIWLPKEKMTKNGKDYRDWLNFYKNASKKAIKSNFDNLKNSALKCKFFDSNGLNKYKINLSNLHYFLNVKNYYTYKIEHKHIDKTSDDQIIFINIVGNIVSKVSPRDIRKFCENYLKNKGQKLEVLNLIKSSPYFNENYLISLDNVQLDFKNYDADTQYFFFQNQVAKITAESIDFKKHGEADNYTWNKSIINHLVAPEQPFFEYCKDDSGRNRVKILREDCQYMKYLINGSRTFWRKELEEPFKNELEKQKYFKENHFTLNGCNLTEEEQIIQEQHFLNKCYAFGYLLHKYKREDTAKMLYIMDDTPKDSEDDANGRTGKSLGLRALRNLAPNRFLIDGKNKSITTDKHIFHGLDEDSSFIEIEDADKFLDVKFFYTKITTGVVVNPKQTKPYELEFEDVPKMALTTNYGLANITGSDVGRLIFVSYSDFYHEKTDNYLERRKVSDDFEGKAFFQTWSKDEYNLFYNFQLQCCQLYLQNQNNEFQAPQNNIFISNLKAGIGDTFFDWADGYFMDENLNNSIPRKEVMKDYTSSGGKKLGKMFKKSLNDYCKLHAWTLNPASQQGKDGRIKINVYDNAKGKHTTEECFYIDAPEAVKPVATEKQEPTEIQTDLPF